MLPEMDCVLVLNGDGNGQVDLEVSTLA